MHYLLLVARLGELVKNRALVGRVVDNLSGFECCPFVSGEWLAS
jgi:hypothetical protein